MSQSPSQFDVLSLINQINNQSIIPSTDVMQLTLTLKMTTAQVVETSVTVLPFLYVTVLLRTTFTRTIKLNLLKYDSYEFGSKTQKGFAYI